MELRTLGKLERNPVSEAPSTQLYGLFAAVVNLDKLRTGIFPFLEIGGGAQPGESSPHDPCAWSVENLRNHYGARIGRSPDILRAGAHRIANRPVGRIRIVTRGVDEFEGHARTVGVGRPRSALVVGGGIDFTSCAIEQTNRAAVVGQIALESPGYAPVAVIGRSPYVTHDDEKVVRRKSGARLELETHVSMELPTAQIDDSVARIDELDKLPTFPSRAGVVVDLVDRDPVRRRRFPRARGTCVLGGVVRKRDRDRQDKNRGELHRLRFALRNREMVRLRTRIRENLTCPSA